VLEGCGWSVVCCRSCIFQGRHRWLPVLWGGAMGPPSSSREACSFSLFSCGADHHQMQSVFTFWSKFACRPWRGGSNGGANPQWLFRHRPVAVVTASSTLTQLGQGGLAIAAVALSIERTGTPGEGAVMVTAFAIGSLLGALIETIRPSWLPPHKEGWQVLRHRPVYCGCRTQPRHNLDCPCHRHFRCLHSIQCCSHAHTA
jgi:hypothetical protein